MPSVHFRRCQGPHPYPSRWSCSPFPLSPKSLLPPLLPLLLRPQLGHLHSGHSGSEVSAACPGYPRPLCLPHPVSAATIPPATATGHSLHSHTLDGRWDWGLICLGEDGKEQGALYVCPVCPGVLEQLQTRRKRPSTREPRLAVSPGCYGDIHSAALEPPERPQLSRAPGGGRDRGFRDGGAAGSQRTQVALGGVLDNLGVGGQSTPVGSTPVRGAARPSAMSSIQNNRS